MSNKLDKFNRITMEMSDLYEVKNKNYGDSFSQSFAEEGMAMPRIRLGDKLSRFKALTRNPELDQDDESIRDTLIDLANYAVMTIMEIDAVEDKKEEEDCPST